MNREILKKIIADQREYKLPRLYFDRLQSKTFHQFSNDPSVLIISGIRRSGKSTILRYFKLDQDERDYYFNFDDERLIDFKVSDFQVLLETFIELFGVQKTFYFDEIQNIEGWERFIRRLYEQENKVYITGSNAQLLSRELGTHLTGRTIQIEIYPLSFKEIVCYESPDLLHKKIYSTSDIGKLLKIFSDYMKFGGIPEYVKFKKEEYLKNLYEGILYRDIIVRHHILNEKAIKELVFYFSSNIGKEFSFSKLCEYIGISSPNTISKYCSYLEDCYLFFYISRYSHSLKKQIQYNKKCYMIDSALIQLIGFRVSDDTGRMLENLVFLHLKMRGDEIYFHKEEKECDFLVRKGNRVVEAYQVTLQLSDQKVRKREVEGLLEALNRHQLNEGTILTENEEEEIEVGIQKIRVLPVWKWLLQ